MSGDPYSAATVLLIFNTAIYDNTIFSLQPIINHSSIVSEFETLGKAYDKARRVVESEGIPKFYLATLCELEDFINEASFFKELFYTYRRPQSLNPGWYI